MVPKKINIFHDDQKNTHTARLRAEFLYKLISYTFFTILALADAENKKIVKS